MNYLKIADAISDMYSNAKLPLTDEQEVMLNGALAVHLQAFAYAITKEKDAEIVLLGRNLIDKDIEVEQLKVMNARLDKALLPMCDALEKSEKENLQLNAKVAMMREAFNQLLDCESEIFSIGVAEAEHITESLYATEQDVTRFINSMKADALEEELNCMNCSVDAESLRRTIKQLRGEYD